MFIIVLLYFLFTPRPALPPGNTVLPQLAAPKIRGGLRSITITWAPPSPPVAGVAVQQYNVYYMAGPGSAFDQMRAQRLTVVPDKRLQTTLKGLDPVANYSVVVTYMAVKAGKLPSFWEKESTASLVATNHSAPDAQSKQLQKQGASIYGTLISASALG